MVAKNGGALRLTTQIATKDESYTITPLENRNGWVNPEDLASMPQCIAQQDQTAWLHAMTKCTSKQCTRHFGVICTRHQWLTQLSCLSGEFSPDVVSQYFPFCSRSVLAKAQLFHWVYTITGRTWLVDVGDANGLQNPSPLSLTRGYTSVEVTDKAPTCLLESVVELSNEPFQHVLASCSFTSDTRHTGNAARPWEYWESQGSIVPLDYETTGYDLTLRRIGYGDYFDRQCFCEVFSRNITTTPCSGPRLVSTRERLWMNATCGPDYLPADWTNGLQTTTFAYIPTEKWRWPECVAAIPARVIKSVDQCTTDACELDANGYCDVKRAVDKACFCRSISYDSCKGPCHVFEARIDFVNWLHDLCGNVDEWSGLPKHWRELAAPTSIDMTPWQWKGTFSEKSHPSHRHTKKLSMCTSTVWKLGSVGLINIATLIASLQTRTFIYHYAYPQSWLLTGLAIAGLHFSANWINAVLIQATAGYEAISIVQLTVLLCSMPRLTWLIILQIVLRLFNSTRWYTIASLLFAEAILQALSVFPMIQTINYGRQHDFYSRGMARLEGAPAAQYMYAGAATWLVVLIVTSVLLLLAVHKLAVPPRSQASKPSALTIARDLMTFFNKQWIDFEEKLARNHQDRDWDPEERPLPHGNGHPHMDYGTIPIEDHKNRTTYTERAMARITLIALISMVFLWITQWVFWAGFIDLSSEEYVLLRNRIVIVKLTSSRYCVPELKLAFLTAVWIIPSAVVVVFTRTP